MVGEMVDPVSILQHIFSFAVKIKETVGTFRHNEEDCRRIVVLVTTVSAVVEGLKRTPEILEDHAMGYAFKALEEALERSWNLVLACQEKSSLRRAWEADNIAENLRRVREDILLNLNAAMFATVACRISVSANNNINQIVAALPDDSLRQEVSSYIADLTTACSHVAAVVVVVPLSHSFSRTGRCSKICLIC